MQQDQQPVKKGMIKVIGSFKYNTEDFLGKGSFGQVYKCVNTETQVEFALKVIPRLKVEKVEDLNKEVNIMKKLTGPNIVRLYKVVGSANNIYQVMDLCESDLYKIKRQKKIFSEVETIKIMTDLLRGFLELIENGVIHRDVKPANILMSKGVYKLADFGLSRIVDDLTNQKFATIVGTPLYMSPQLLANQKYTTKSDIWSFGFIFYELLYGRTPWTGTSSENLTQNIREKDLIFDDRIKVSDLTKNVIQRCLAKDEENRISWLELFQHPVFASQFVKIQNLEIRCNQLEKFIANSLRLQIANQNISIDELISRNNIKDKLSPLELELLFKKIDKNLSKMEIQYIFNNIKQRDSQHITIEDFQNWLDKFSIQFSNYRKYKEHQCLLDLKSINRKFNQTLQMCFDKFNKKKDGKLLYQEFQLLILKLNENYSDQQIFEAYNFIEKNNKGYLTIDEFQNALDFLKN